MAFFSDALHAAKMERRVRASRKATDSRRLRQIVLFEQRIERKRARARRGDVTCTCDAFPYPHRLGSETCPSSAAWQAFEDALQRAKTDEEAASIEAERDDFMELLRLRVEEEKLRARRLAQGARRKALGARR